MLRTQNWATLSAHCPRKGEGVPEWQGGWGKRIQSSEELSPNLGPVTPVPWAPFSASLLRGDFVSSLWSTVLDVTAELTFPAHHSAFSLLLGARSTLTSSSSLTLSSLASYEASDTALSKLTNGLLVATFSL